MQIGLRKAERCQIRGDGQPDQKDNISNQHQERLSSVFRSGNNTQRYDESCEQTNHLKVVDQLQALQGA